MKLYLSGHIEPQTDSQVNLGSNTVRFANAYVILIMVMVVT